MLPATDPVLATPAVPPTSARWTLRLLGGLWLDDGRQALDRLPSRAVTALLARLALAPGRAHPREELVELLWPGVAADVGRNRLRQALSALRSVLEPASAAAPGAVLAANRMQVRVVPGALWCDAVAFEQAVRRRDIAAARALYRGDLLPGYYDEWIADERLRLEALRDRLGDPDASDADTTHAVAGDAATQVTGAAPDVGGSRRAPGSPPTSRQASLPHYLTRPLAVDDAAQALAAQLTRDRLITLTGPGGHGKTRLAVEAARRCDTGDPPWFDLVAFVPLVACTDAAALADALLLALGASPGNSGADPVTDVAALLAGRRSLLVLDNFEQLLPQAAAPVARLLERCVGLHLLVTSRRVLGLDGEHEWPVPPLPLPEADLPLDALARNPAVALFEDRARAARADFHLHASNAAAVAAVVRAVDGIPLAIELAASRVRSLSPSALAGLLEAARERPSADTLAMLARSGPRAGSDPRQASMLAVVAWSWQLLSPSAQTLLASVAVWVSGFALSAARAVAPDDMPAAAVAAGIDELAAHSMLRVVDAGDDGEPRFAVYELIREFALLQLSPTQGARSRSGHRQWLLRWARGLGPVAPYATLRRELPNVAAAFASAADDGAPAEAAALARALHAAFIDIALPPGMLAALERACGALTDTSERSMLHMLLARAWHRAGHFEATQRHADAAMAALPPSGADRAMVLARLAHVRWRLWRDRGVQAWLDEAEACAGPDAPADLHASVAATRGAIARRDDPDRAIALQKQALALWSAAGDVHGVHTALYNLSLALNERAADRAKALEAIDHMLAGTRAAGDWGQHATGCNQRGEILSWQRRWGDAASAYREGVAVAWHSLEMLPMSYCLWNLPGAWAHLRRPDDAARLFGFAVRFWVERFGALRPFDEPDVRRMRRLIGVQIGAARCALRWAEGERLALRDAVALALA